jgi:two-component system LytT family response regulator
VTARQPVRTLIVDDEPLARRRLRAILADEADIEIVGEAASGRAAVKTIAELRPDLLLLDIQMPGMDGFEVLEEIADEHQPVIVFITAHDEHALRAFEVQAIDYVLKPVIEDRLRAAVRRAVTRLREHRQADLSDAMSRLLDRVRRSRGATRLAVKNDRGVALVPLAEIHWIEADGDIVKLHTAKGAQILRTTMADLEARLAGGPFARVHRSAIVNTDQIQEIQPLFKGGYEIVLKNGARLRSGRLYRANVQALMRQS